MHTCTALVYTYIFFYIYIYPQRPAVQRILNAAWKANIQELHSFYRNSWGTIPPVKLHQAVNGFQGRTRYLQHRDQQPAPVPVPIHSQSPPAHSASLHSFASAFCELKVWPRVQHSTSVSLSEVPPWRTCRDCQKWKDWEGVLKCFTLLVKEAVKESA